MRPIDGTWGAKLQDGTWTGMVGQVYEQVGDGLDAVQRGMIIDISVVKLSKS